MTGDETTFENGSRRPHDQTDYTAADEDNSDEHTALMENIRRKDKAKRKPDYIERVSQSYLKEETRGRAKQSDKSRQMTFGSGHSRSS